MENIVAFAGYTSKSQNMYVFNDVKSLLLTLPNDIDDFCGEKVLSFKINNTITTALYGDNRDYFYFGPGSDSKDFGVGQAQVIASIKNYPTIISTALLFTATILGTIAPVI